MNIQPFKMPDFIAREKWREAVAAAKQTKNPMYRDIAKLYNQIKSGKLIIDIREVITAGGVHTNYHPKLAIARANIKKVTCFYRKDSTVKYLSRESSWREKAEDIILKDCLPVIPTQYLPIQTWNQMHASEFRLEAPVPMIPPAHLPSKLNNDLYILWEVDVWKMIPPTDPYLLKRLTKTHFRVEAAWDLTPLEKSVMAAYL